MLSKFLSMKAAAVFGATLLSAGAAAAATGSLPAPAQRVVSSTVREIGVDLPSGHDATTTGASITTEGSATTEGSTTTGSVDPSASTTTEIENHDDSNIGGQCQAYLEHVKNGNLDKFPAKHLAELQAAADAKGQSIADFCKVNAASAKDDHESSITEAHETESSEPKPDNSGHGKSDDSHGKSSTTVTTAAATTTVAP